MFENLCKHCIDDDGVCDQEMCNDTTCDDYEPIEEEDKCLKSAIADPD